MVLLDGGAQISSISRKWVDEMGLPVYELENLVEIIQAGGSILDYEGYCEGLKPPLESFSRIDHAVIVMSSNY